MAEKNLLEVMKAKGAVYGNPILRPDLRAEARKRIGDTGLLDHLLKQMAGKVAPGGKERFRRRHNAEGAMEYWLENADLVEIRREAGVQDAYWTPPPGWNPGDCPTQDPVCAKELKQLKEVTTKLQRQMEELVSRKQLEEEVGKFRREMKQLLSEKGSITTLTTNCQEMDPNSTSLVTHQSELQASFDTWERYKEQLMLVPKSVTKIEEEMGKLKNNKRWEELPKRETGAEKETEEEGQKGGGYETGGEIRRDDESRKEAEEVVVAGSGEEETEKKKRTEEKAEKIERLKSGFKICKPHGTFLWPNMGINLQQLPLSPMSQLGDLFLIGGGPPSVNSSSAASPPFPQQLLLQPSYNDLHDSQLSPVRRPLAERRAFSVSLRPLIAESPRHENCGSNCIETTTPTQKTTSIINLNDLPISTPAGDRIQPGHKIPTIISPCMQQQQQQEEEEHMVIASSSSMSKSIEMAAAESVGGRSSDRGGGMTTTIRQVGGNWLALGTPNSV